MRETGQTDNWPVEDYGWMGRGKSERSEAKVLKPLTRLSRAGLWEPTSENPSGGRRLRYAPDPRCLAHRAAPAILDMAKLDPAGREYPPLAYVFGALGTRLKTVKKAWETVVLKSHGHEPEWIAGKLPPVSREWLRAINLHLHDLRHEAGCRWLEAGWPIHHVQEMLGHANLSQTSTYCTRRRWACRSRCGDSTSRVANSWQTLSRRSIRLLATPERSRTEKDLLH